MLGLIIVALWTAFVTCYLIWQQVSGDFAKEAIGNQLSAISNSISAPATQGRGMTADS